MTPLIDIIFLLLVFFVWNVNLQRPEYELASSVTPPAVPAGAAPDAAPRPEADFHELVVHIGWMNARPVWRLGTRSVESLAELKQRLRQVAEIQNAAPLVVHPEPEVPLGEVIDVYDSARQAGFQQIRFTASTDPS